MPTTILLVDDHPVFRKGLRQLLEEEQDFKVVGEAGDGKEAIALVGKLSPDVVVMDINMPNFNGIEAPGKLFPIFLKPKSWPCPFTPGNVLSKICCVPGPLATS
jgi:DNA-binding NarL/FixJ family response regulator